MTTSPSASDRTCFFISPIGDEGSEVRSRSDTVKRLIVEAALVPGIVGRVVRADEEVNPGEITPAIITAILAADLVVADLTGSNPNVFYELAIAHAYGRPTVHIRKTGELIPFDLKDVRVFEYGLDLESGDRARRSVEAAARNVLEEGNAARTPLSGATALLNARESADAGDRISAEVVTRLGELEGAIERLSRMLRQDVDSELAIAERRLINARELHLDLVQELTEAQAALEVARSDGSPQVERLVDVVRTLTRKAADTAGNLDAAESTVQSVMLSMRRHPSRGQLRRSWHQG